MHPDIESFLAEILSSIQQTSHAISRVVVEPDYDAEPNAADADAITRELVQSIEKQPLDETALASGNGLDLQGIEQYPSLRKYVRRITLHSDQSADPWIEIAPPGNWI